MASLYEQLMASKGAPKAAEATNSTQLRKAPVSLRSAMRKYAEGGGVGSSSPSDADIASFVQANINNPQAIAQAAQQYGVSADALARATGYSSGQVNDYFGNAGINFGGSRSEPVPQTMTPPMEPPRPPTNDFDRFKQDMEQTRRPPEPPRPPEPRYPDEIPPRPRVPDLETPFIAPTTPQGPRTSYRQNDDGSLEEIGYDGQPISGYTAQQTAMDRATRGLDPSEYTYVWNGQGYDKVRMGGITMDDGTFIPGATNSQGGTNIGTPDFFEQYANDPETMARLRQMYGFTGNQPEYQEPQIGYNPEPRYPEENVPPPPREDPREEPRFYEPEIPQYPTDPGFYQPPVYDNPTPIGVAKSLERGGDLAKVIQDLISRGRTGGDLAALIAKALASGGGSLEKQPELMALLDSLKR
jgi:hypothetical protein